MSRAPNTLSIVAVTFNEVRHIAKLQRSVDALRRPDGFTIETILVDGGSKDGTAEAAREAGFTKVVIMPGANIPVCRNRGAQEANGEYLAYVDGDCELAEDWLERALPFLRNNEQIIVCWPARPPDPMNWLQAAWYYHWMTKNHQLEDFQGEQVVKTEGFRLATTRNMVMTRATSDAVEGFNNGLPTGEDTDFAFRVYMKGIPVLAYPKLSVLHHGEPATLRQFYRQQIWHANRRSYEHVVKLSGGKVGGNAPKYALLFTASVFLAPLGLALSAALGHVWPLALTVPLLGVSTGPAFLMSAKGGGWKHFPALSLLYTLYGVARMIDLLGLSKEKPSWKRPAAPTPDAGAPSR